MCLIRVSELEATEAVLDEVNEVKKLPDWLNTPSHYFKKPKDPKQDKQKII